MNFVQLNVLDLNRLIEAKDKQILESYQILKLQIVVFFQVYNIIDKINFNLKNIELIN